MVILIWLSNSKGIENMGKTMVPNEHNLTSLWEGEIWVKPILNGYSLYESWDFFVVKV